MLKRAVQLIALPMPVYITNMLKSLKIKSLENNAQLATMCHPNAFPSVAVPKASAFDWNQGQLCKVLHNTVAYSGLAGVWKAAQLNSAAAVRELTW